MNLRASTALSYLLISAIVWSGHSLAEEQPDGHWSRDLDGAWCLKKYKQSGFCLPAEFKLQRFETGRAEFAIDSLHKPISLITYEAGPAYAEIDYLLSGDFWQLIESRTVGNVVVTRIEPLESKRDEAHGIVLYVLDFEQRFFLIINSSDQATHQMLIKSLPTQWRNNKGD